MKARGSSVSVPEAAARQRQILRDLPAKQGRQLRRILRVREFAQRLRSPSADPLWQLRLALREADVSAASG
jgi:hypothetical protein